MAEAKPINHQGVAIKGDRQNIQKGWWNLLAQIDVEQYRMHFHQLALHLYHYANEQCELPIAANLPSNGNASQAPTKSGATGLFSMHIYYNEQDAITDDLDAQPLFNGNVAATACKVSIVKNTAMPMNTTNCAASKLRTTINTGTIQDATP